MGISPLPRVGVALLLTAALAVPALAATAPAAAGPVAASAAVTRPGTAGHAAGLPSPPGRRAPSGWRPLSRAQIRAGLRPGRPAGTVRCRSRGRRHPVLARRLARRITAALRGRMSIVGLALADQRTGISCALHRRRHFYSASVVKVTILAALLRKLQAGHRRLSPAQAGLAAQMITESSNTAASALWAQDGRRALRRFLYLARMRHTVLGPGGYWGLTQITAQDELRLLRVLTSAGPVLSRPARAYIRRLMARVIPGQRWGTPAGVRPGVVVHVKNGWLPLPSYGWRINSLGIFSRPHTSYMIVVLTKNNPTMAYGVATIQAAARVINHRLG